MKKKNLKAEMRKLLAQEKRDEQDILPNQAKELEELYQELEQLKQKYFALSYESEEWRQEKKALILALQALSGNVLETQKKNS